MRKQPASERASTPSVSSCTEVSGVLLVNPGDEDTLPLEEIPDFTCTIVTCASADRALAVLRTSSYAIILWDADLASSTWQEMLEYLSLLPDPPLLIVTSRLADEYLWAEALNLGAWDVLAKPFDREEVSRVLGFAWRHWQDRHGIHDARSTQRRAAAGT